MKNWVGVFFLFCLFGIFYVLKNLNFYELWRYLIQINPTYLLLAIVFCFLTFVIGSLRMKYICGTFSKINFNYMVLVTLAGSFVNVCTPGAGIGGEPVKSYFLGKKYKKSQSKFFGAILAEKFFHLSLFALVIVFSIMFILFYIKISDSLMIILQTILFSVFILVGIFLFITFKKVKFNFWFLIRKFYWLWFIKNHFESPNDFEKYVKKRVRWFVVFFRSLLKNKKLVFLEILLSIFYWVFFYSAFWILFLSFENNIGFLQVAIVVTLASLIGELSPSPGGIGITEGGMFLLYNVMGVNLSLAIIVTLVSRAIFYFFSFVIGGISLAYLKFDLNRIKSR